jgi:glutathione synthase/RimK-type ligase-like ATP-grasp enzyme
LTTKRLLLHVNKLRGQLSAPRVDMSVEEAQIVKCFLNRGWQCHLIDWRDFDLRSLHCSDSINAETKERISPLQVNKASDLVFVRSLGSVQAQYDELARYFLGLSQDFGGAVINHPRSMLYGMNKFYLFDLAADSHPVVESRFFEKTTSYENIVNAIPWQSNESIIKPICGECGNSVEFLSTIDEGFLRQRQNLVRGWLIQPYIRAITAGEISMIYIDKRFMFAVKKTPRPGEFRVNARWNPKYELIEPSDEILRVGREALNFWPHPLYLARVDVICDRDSVIILEVETVNPGFLYGSPPYDQSQLAVLDQLENLGSRILDLQQD